ncbi:MAG: hypothetical protein ACYS47_21085 [Planctomycetota bacterium]|jgi:hypothetical protein
MNRTWMLVIALAACSAGTMQAEAAPSFPWDYEGYRSILDAAALAQKENQFILVGLSGSHG